MPDDSTQSTSATQPAFGDPGDPEVYQVQTKGPGPGGHLPLDPDFLRHAPSGDIFGLTMDAGMGWAAEHLRRKEVSLITDARFSGVSTGACIGHVGPEALAGGPLGKVREADTIRIIVDRVNLTGSIDMVGCDGRSFDPQEGARVLASRPPHPDLHPAPNLPADTHLWAALQQISGGAWSGCVYDVDKIIALLDGGRDTTEP